jgi:hypothetical protein
LSNGHHKADSPWLAGIFAALTPYANLREASAAYFGFNLPGLSLAEIKDGLRAGTDTLLAEGAFIFSKMHLREAAITTVNDLGFTSLNAGIAATTKIGKRYVCLYPRWALYIAGLTTKKSSPPLIYFLTHSIYLKAFSLADSL